MEKGLFIREWVTISLVLGLVAVLLAISWSASENKEKNLIADKEKKQTSQIEIEIFGAVKKPGVYYFAPGITTKEVLKHVPLDRKADRKQIDVKKVLYSSQRLLVPYKEEICRITGDLGKNLDGNGG